MNEQSTKNKVAIRVNGVSKDFILPHHRQDSLKNTIIHPFNKTRKESQKALNNIDFEIKKGEFFGIVGRNGSGKSTLLKILAGVYVPTKGTVEINGSLVPFIELGVGFNPDLTGRDNVYLNGSLLGFSRSDIAKMYDEIVEFAELERFMDQKLKNYSSGMQVRLAFSIAIRANSDILLLDEVIAVGDEAFQKKCFSYFDQLKREKKSVVLVTHDMSAVERFCDRAALLSKGSLMSIGSSRAIAQKYRQLNEDNIAKLNEVEAEKRLKEVEDESGTNIRILEKTIYKHGDELTLSIEWSEYLAKSVKNVGVALFTAKGEYVFGTNTLLEKKKIPKNRASIKYKLDLGDNDYFFKIGLFGKSDSEVVRFIDSGPRFTIKSNNKWHGIVKLDHEWIAR